MLGLTHLRIVVCALAACVVSACGSPDPVDREIGSAVRPATAVSDRPRIVVLGDSLTAGLGLQVDEAFPAVLQRRLHEAGYAYEVINAGVSGDTTAGGLRRVEWVLDGDVRVLVVALGGNDGLRGLPVEAMERNLSEIVATAADRDIPVILAGMEAPPNYGPVYTAGFRSAFRDVADAYDVMFVPFLLEGVAGVSELNQPDGIHPNSEGARRIADHLWSTLEALVEDPPTQ